MSQNRESKSKDKRVAVVIGATSKWQSNGRNTLLVHGKALNESDFPVGVRWGVGGAIAQKFAQEGFLVVLTTRSKANAASLAQAIERQNGECLIVELDLASQASIATAFATISAGWLVSPASPAISPRRSGKEEIEEAQKWKPQRN